MNWEYVQLIQLFNLLNTFTHTFFLSASSFKITQALSEEISEHKSDLTDTVEAGRELEGYTDAEPASLPDIGYSDLQRRYENLKVRDV